MVRTHTHTCRGKCHTHTRSRAGWVTRWDVAPPAPNPNTGRQIREDGTQKPGSKKHTHTHGATPIIRTDSPKRIRSHPPVPYTHTHTHTLKTHTHTHLEKDQISSPCAIHHTHTPLRHTHTHPSLNQHGRSQISGPPRLWWRSL